MYHDTIKLSQHSKNKVEIRLLRNTLLKEHFLCKMLYESNLSMEKEKSHATIDIIKLEL